MAAACLGCDNFPEKGNDKRNAGRKGIPSLLQLISKDWKQRWQKQWAIALVVCTESIRAKIFSFNLGIRIADCDSYGARSSVRV